MENTQIKAIETCYNGYRFRSRLEARWAVFFDTAGIKYRYEEQGFEKDGERYLPDFYLPELDVYAEVKGNRHGALEEVERIKDFIFWGSPIKKIIILSEIPYGIDKGLWHYPCLYYDTKHERTQVYWWYFFDEYEAPVNGTMPQLNLYKAPWLSWQIGKESKHFDENTCLLARGAGDLRPKPRVPDVWYCDADDWRYNKLTLEALIKARQARFEHGEKG